MLISVTDLGLTLTKHVVIGELNIMLIMIILLAGVFFCYSLIRLWILVVRGDPPEIPRAIDPRGYAVPRNPIRVVMAQDEEAAGVENEAMTMKPPAYGLWRESVVCTGITRDIVMRTELTLTSSVWIQTASSGNGMILLSPRLLHQRRDRGRRPTFPKMEYPTWLMRCLGLLLRHQRARTSRCILQNEEELVCHLRVERGWVARK